MARKKIVKVETILPASADKVWSLLTEFDTLRFVARPLISFKPPDGVSRFREGEKYDFRMRIFGIISMGVHSIQIVTIDKSKFTIVSHEHDRAVKTWNHTIKLEPIDNSTTRYADTVEVDAGKMTNVVAVFAKIFYRHRQRRWKKLLSDTLCGITAS